MKRYFVETNGYNCVAFVDENNKAIVLHDECFDEPLTIKYAKNADYSNIDGCETAEECICAMGGESNNVVFIDNFDEFQNDDNVTVTEF